MISASCCPSTIKVVPRFSIPEDFGELHGNIFRHFVNSETYKANFRKAPVICLSVSSKDTYRRTGNQHPVLGVEYQPDGESSLTDQYFAKMGLQGALLHAGKQRGAVRVLLHRGFAE